MNNKEEGILQNGHTGVPIKGVKKYRESLVGKGHPIIYQRINFNWWTGGWVV